MPDPVEVRADVVVDATVQQTWAAVTDWGNQAIWIPATTVRVTGGDGLSVGSTLEAFTGAGRVGFTDPMVVTTWDPPHLCVVRHTGTVVRGTGDFEVLALPDGRSRFLWAEHVELPEPARAALCLARPLVDAALALALRRLAKSLVSSADGRV
jgi:hypothetical protein